MSNQQKPLAAGFVYVPPEGSSQFPMGSDIFTQLELDLAKLGPTHHTILMGDFNAHTNSEPDTGIKIEGSDNPFETTIDPARSVTYPTRRSLDKRPLNSHGKCLIRLCTTSNHLTINGHMFHDTNGGFCKNLK